MPAELNTKKCLPCEGGIPVLSREESEALVKLLSNGWEIVNNHHLLNKMSFVSFRHTMNMVNKIASLAETEGHHPDMHISYGSLAISIWTHSIDGLSENDFILAAKIDLL
jgi:4a-hydroxytetrahydrobiopterin dehydratase